MNDITGRTFSRLTVLYLHEKKVLFVKGKKIHRAVHMWMCVCTCGRKEPVQQSDLTGKKASRCSKCLAKELKAQNKVGNGTPQIPRNTAIYRESMNRGTLEGFKRYFKSLPYMFWDTFGHPYSDETAEREFTRILGSPTN
jgi:hypothetical protein